MYLYIYFFYMYVSMVVVAVGLILNFKKEQMRVSYFINS